MKTLMIALLTTVLVTSIGPNAHADDQTDAEAEKDTPTSSVDNPVVKPKPMLSFGVYGTFYNTYNRGNLDTWFSELTGDPDRQVDQGSPAHFGFVGSVLFPVKPDAVWIGASFGATIPSANALWGTYTFFGGRQELTLSPWVFSMGMPIRVRLGESDRLFATATPALLMGWVTGTYDWGAGSVDFTPSPSFGFGLAVGAEAMLNRTFGADFTVGFRMLKADLAYSDSGSSTGFSQPLLNSGEEVQADLSGTFMAVGISLRH